MRLLHVVPSYLPAVRYGGPIASVHGLCRALAQCGNEVEVFTTSVDGSNDSDVAHGERVDIDGVGVWYFRSRRMRRLYWAPSMVEALRRKAPGFDLVHAHSVYLWPTWAAARAARARRVPYIVSPRGMLASEFIRRKNRLVKRAWIALIERRNLELAAGVHVTSGSETAELAKLRLRLPKVFEVPNGVEIPPAVAGEQPQRDPALILYVGRISWEKGLDRLIPAMAAVPQARLVVAGNDETGYASSLRALARSSGVSDRVQFIGPVSGARKENLYRTAAVCVLPSYSENFGVVVVEAMARGCPVLVTREVGMAAAVEGSSAGLVVEGAAAAIGAGLSSLLSDGALRERAGEAGRTAAARYEWRSVAREMLACYEEALACSS